jgi:rhodanese-related sulfurtransferase
MVLRRIVNPDTTTPEVDVAETVQRWSDRSAQLVDVREPKEWVDGHIPGAIHIPLGDLARRANELIKETPVITICHSGVRSLAAADELIEQGFADVASLNGGMVAWSKAGHPVES